MCYSSKENWGIFYLILIIQNACIDEHGMLAIYAANVSSCYKVQNLCIREVYF